MEGGEFSRRLKVIGKIFRLLAIPVVSVLVMSAHLGCRHSMNSTDSISVKPSYPVGSEGDLDSLTHWLKTRSDVSSMSLYASSNKHGDPAVLKLGLTSQDKSRILKMLSGMTCCDKSDDTFQTYLLVLRAKKEFPQSHIPRINDIVLEIGVADEVVVRTNFGEDWQYQDSVVFECSGLVEYLRALMRNHREQSAKNIKE